MFSILLHRYQTRFNDSSCEEDILSFVSRKLRKQRWECTDAQRALDPLSCRRKWNLIKERATLLNGRSKRDEVDVLRDSGRARPTREARHPEEFVARDLRRWRRCKYLLIAPRATYRVRCKPTLQNRRTIHTASPIPTTELPRSFGSDRQAGRPARSPCLLCTRRINGSGIPLSRAGRESAECFVNSWRSAGRRAEGANRRGSDLEQLLHKTGYLTITESHDSFTTSVLRRRRTREKEAREHHSRIIKKNLHRSAFLVKK